MTDRERLEVGPDLFIELVDVADLVEQDVNAQVMAPKHFDRLTENVKQRGALESVPYGSIRPDGRIDVISGHHRGRSAKAAGVDRVAVLVDYAPMTRSEMTAKQIAHNELTGNPDENVLRQMVASLDAPSDFLTTGLPDEYLPMAPPDTTKLFTPGPNFSWKVVTFEFLPRDLDDFKGATVAIEGRPDLVGVAPLELYERFARAVVQLGKLRDIRSVGTTIAYLTRVAMAELEGAERDLDDQHPVTEVTEVPEDWVPVPLVDAMPASAADVVRLAIEAMVESQEEPMLPAQALELICADYLAGTNA